MNDATVILSMMITLLVLNGDAVVVGRAKLNGPCKHFLQIRAVVVLATGWNKRIIATNLKFWVQGMGIDQHNGKADLLSFQRD